MGAGLSRVSPRRPNPFVQRHKPINYIFDDFARYGEWSISMEPEDYGFRFELKNLRTRITGDDYVPPHIRRFVAPTPADGFGAAKVMADAWEYASLNRPPKGDGDFFWQAWSSLLGFLEGWDYDPGSGLDFAANIEEHWIPLREESSSIAWFYDQPAEFRKGMLDRALAVHRAILDH